MALYSQCRKVPTAWMIDWIAIACEKVYRRSSDLGELGVGWEWDWRRQWGELPSDIGLTGIRRERKKWEAEMISIERDWTRYANLCQFMGAIQMHGLVWTFPKITSRVRRSLNWDAREMTLKRGWEMGKYRNLQRSLQGDELEMKVDGFIAT